MTRLFGHFRPPGDKSVSHRAMILAGMAHGTSILSGLNSGNDCGSTRRVLSQLGVTFSDEGDRVHVTGAGTVFGEPSGSLDCGNSGTTMRLLMGVLAAMPGLRVLAGDESLSRRPMRRVAGPLETMGASIRLRDGDFPPVTVSGRKLEAARHDMMVASAQVKSALLLAGTLTEGTTAVRESIATRDHTERLLAYFGADVRTVDGTIEVKGTARLEGRAVQVPGDLSAAAFALVAAAIADEAEVTAAGTGVNPTRRGFLDVLARMGASIAEASLPDSGQPEPAADITVQSAPLSGVVIEGGETAAVIDELPILAVAACTARGTTTVRDAAELRVKESDRIRVLVTGLRKLGARIEERPDGFTIEGGGEGFRFQGASVDSEHDHRLAMAFTVAGLRANGEVRVSGMDSVAISDPDFLRTLAGLQQR